MDNFLILFVIFVKINAMIILNIILGILLFSLHTIMMAVMIIIERDKPKNIIIWSVIFLVSSIVGYIFYIILRNIVYKKRETLIVKQNEDKVYAQLVSNKLKNNEIILNHEVFEFNRLAFDAKTTMNNHYEFLNTKQAIMESLLTDIGNAKNYIILELNGVNLKYLPELKDAIIAKAKENLMVRLVVDGPIQSAIKKELKLFGVKVNRFSKYNTVDKALNNLRNIISIDGEIAYVCNLKITSHQAKSSQEKAYSGLRLRGHIVQEIDLQSRKDAVFGAGKFIPYDDVKQADFNNNNFVQFIANDTDHDMELAVIKSICTAKKSIQLELTKFIPTESIMSLLKFAINSNIEVRLMVPLKNDKHGKYYASRAYAKELALFGANVYLYDGFINFNAITIDDEYVIYGSFVIDREHVNTCQQSMLFIHDSKAVKNFNNLFNAGIENSYRINNAKMLLMREKFFKNFV